MQSRNDEHSASTRQLAIYLSGCDGNLSRTPLPLYLTSLLSKGVQSSCQGRENIGPVPRLVVREIGAVIFLGEDLAL